MVLSNAERQRRFRQARKAAASSAITRDMVLRAARAVWEQAAEFETPRPKWVDAVKQYNKRGEWRAWFDLLSFPPDYLDDPENFAEYGADAETVEAVARIVALLVTPPTPDELAD